MKKEKNTTGLISKSEKNLALYCIDAALRHGAGQVRVSLSKSTLDTFGMLNGELDKVTHAADRSIFLYIFADNRYGTFSTNMLEEASLEQFTAQAVEAVRMLAEDRHRRLPDPERTEKGAVTGQELGLYDEAYGDLGSDEKSRIAAEECIWGRAGLPDGLRIISEECEYSDSVDDNFLADSSGFRGRHTETSFAICSEITIEDTDGKKYSGYWWDSSPCLSGLQRGQCSRIALGKAVKQVRPLGHEGGSFTMVVDRSVSSRLVSPLFSALNTASIQQESSFLKNSLGEKIFCGGLSITDAARTCGKPGARLFDTEGVATKDMDIIVEGTVKTYFTNTYMALKTGMEATVEGVSRPVLLPYSKDGRLPDDGVFDAGKIIQAAGSGIYVTGFNGGNCNSTTGNFSYGIEGFAFKDGKITHPVREMVITGNMISLWNNLAYAGNDARACTRWQIPSLCFSNVDFSA